MNVGAKAHDANPKRILGRFQREFQRLHATSSAENERILHHQSTSTNNDPSKRKRISEQRIGSKVIEETSNSFNEQSKRNHQLTETDLPLDFLRHLNFENPGNKIRPSNIYASTSEDKPTIANDHDANYQPKPTIK